MNSELNTDESKQREISQAKFRMAFFLLLFYLITLVGGYITFPFLGFTSSIQNVIYGIIVGSPFWIIVIISLVNIRREML